MDSRAGRECSRPYCAANESFMQSLWLWLPSELASAQATRSSLQSLDVGVGCSPLKGGLERVVADRGDGSTQSRAHHMSLGGGGRALLSLLSAGLKVTGMILKPRAPSGVGGGGITFSGDPACFPRAGFWTGALAVHSHKDPGGRCLHPLCTDDALAALMH